MSKLKARGTTPPTLQNIGANRSFSWTDATKYYAPKSLKTATKSGLKTGLRAGAATARASLAVGKTNQDTLSGAADVYNAADGAVRYKNAIAKRFQKPKKALKKSAINRLPNNSVVRARAAFNQQYREGRSFRATQAKQKVKNKIPKNVKRKTRPLSVVARGLGKFFKPIKAVGQVLGVLVKTLSAILLPLILGIFLVFMLLFSFNLANSTDTDTIIPIKISGSYNGKAGTISINGDGVNINNIDISGSQNVFSGVYKTGAGATNIPLPGSPANLSNFTFMGKETVTARSSNQYKTLYGSRTKKIVTSDGNGFVRIGNDYAIALGTGFIAGDPQSAVGKQRFRITFADGMVINATLADVKANEHTDPSHKYQYHDKSVLEFIMQSTNAGNKKPPTKTFKSKLTKIERLSGDSVTLSGKIKGNEVSITGRVNGVAFEATGTYKDGKITADGLLGNDITVNGSGANAACQWAKKIAADNRFTYGGYQCHYCKGTKTEYVCTTFVRAAYAHGAKDSFAQRWDISNTGGFVGDLYNVMVSSKHWRAVGYVPPDKLKPGDVLFVGSSHVEIYIGNGQVAGARTNTVAIPDQIIVANANGLNYDKVLRYVGKSW